MRPLLVGEDNPHQESDPLHRYALYCEPLGSAGWNLCHQIMRLTKKEYVKRFERRNLCVGKWSASEAKEAARSIVARRARPAFLLDGTVLPAEGWNAIVLFGAKVAAAFGAKEFKPYTVSHVSGFIRFVTLPHPSGKNHMWNEPQARERARGILREAGVL